ncbi:unnamed protein product [Anisakis simplex]|uniref:Uncharacterized protein n=1 Tax=Anisakis simplex TaxID=6269 RepID=A0A0M3KK87_ANISI|nr:unnamed protein product [Anisakis simplex]
MQIKHRERQLKAEESVVTRSSLNRQRSNVNRNAKEFSKFWTRGGSLQPSSPFSSSSTTRRSINRRRTHQNDRSVSPCQSNAQQSPRMQFLGM